MSATWGASCADFAVCERSWTMNAGIHQETDLTTAEHPLLLFYDGDCSFCARWVERVKKADTALRLRYGQQQGKTFQQVKQAHPELSGIESVVLLKHRGDGGEDLLLRSEAIHEAIRGLPGFGFFDFVLNVVPKPIADLGYRFIATQRSLLFGKWHECRPAIESDRDRYVD